MEHPTDDASAWLARNLTDLRATRKMTQSTLAKLAGLPRSTVGSFESGSGNPSLHNLLRLAAALGVSIEELLARPRARCLLIKSGDHRRLQRGGGSVIVHKLLPDPIPGMEIDEVLLEPKARMTGVPHTRNTKEYLFVLSGAVEIEVMGERHRAESGDLLAFPGDEKHAYVNADGRACRFLSVVALAP